METCFREDTGDKGCKIAKNMDVSQRSASTPSQCIGLSVSFFAESSGKISLEQMLLDFLHRRQFVMDVRGEGVGEKVQHQLLQLCRQLRGWGRSTRGQVVGAHLLVSWIGLCTASRAFGAGRHEEKERCFRRQVKKYGHSRSGWLHGILHLYILLACNESAAVIQRLLNLLGTSFGIHITTLVRYITRLPTYRPELTWTLVFFLSSQPDHAKDWFYRSNYTTYLTLLPLVTFLTLQLYKGDASALKLGTLYPTRKCCCLLARPIILHHV